MASKLSIASTFLLILTFTIPTVPVQLHLQEGEEIAQNNVDTSQLNECLTVQSRSNDVGVCFGKEVLNNLNKYDESESFSLANGVSFVRDEKTPRDFSSFLDKDPMDIRSIVEGASSLISKRSLHWDLSTLYPGLVMRIGPTLANGVLEFVMDPRIKDRAYHQHPHSGEITTGRLIARNLLVPFLLGFKFQLSTLLPLILGVLLIASKKAFLLAKIALLAVTLFSGSSSPGGSYPQFGNPGLASYTSSYDSFGHHGGHGHGGHGQGYYNRNPHHAEYFYREKSAEQSTATPITPDELRDRLERLFITKKDHDEHPDETKIRNARNFVWTPINAG